MWNVGFVWEPSINLISCQRYGARCTVKDPQPGDIVFFDWNKDGRYDHTGIFESFIEGYAYFNCIEGNTAVGNDSNGGNVMRRIRSVSTAIFVRP